MASLPGQFVRMEGLALPLNRFGDGEKNDAVVEGVQASCAAARCRRVSVLSETLSIWIIPSSMTRWRCQLALKVLDIAVVARANRKRIGDCLEPLRGGTRDQVGRGRLNDALLFVGDALNHCRVGVHAQDNGVLALLKPDIAGDFAQSMYQFAQQNNWPFGGAISFILMIATIILTAAAHLIVQRRYR